MCIVKRSHWRTGALTHALAGSLFPKAPRQIQEYITYNQAEKEKRKNPRNRRVRKEENQKRNKRREKKEEANQKRNKKKKKRITIFSSPATSG